MPRKHTLKDVIVSAVDEPERVIIGVAGIPGAGKTTFAKRLVSEINEAMPGAAAYVPMDGFHLSNDVLVESRAHTRKGAPDTFDVAGYANALERIKSCKGTVYVPGYSHVVHDPIAAAHEIDPTSAVVVTEGSYLLLGDGNWQDVSSEIDYCAWIDCDETVARMRLAARQVQIGATHEGARKWVSEVDGPNIETAFATRSAADEIVNPSGFFPLVQKEDFA